MWLGLITQQDTGTGTGTMEFMSHTHAEDAQTSHTLVFLKFSSVESPILSFLDSIFIGL